MTQYEKDIAAYYAAVQADKEFNESRRGLTYVHDIAVALQKEAGKRKVPICPCGKWMGMYNGFCIDCASKAELSKSEDKEFNETQEKKALRYNDGKPQYSLIDMHSLLPLVNVLEFGAQKYARDNWKGEMDLGKIMDSMLRHIAAMESEPYDRESGIHHIGHILANAMFYSYHLKRLGVAINNPVTAVNINENVEYMNANGAIKIDPQAYRHMGFTDGHGSPTPTEVAHPCTECVQLPTDEGGQSNIPNAVKKTGHNFTTRPLHSIESDKS